MSFYYQRNVSGLKRFDNSNNVVELYSYGGGSAITGFTPTISGLIANGTYNIDSNINTDGTGAGAPRVSINGETGALIFDTTTRADANTSPTAANGGPSDTIPNFYGVNISYDDGVGTITYTQVYFKVLSKTLTVAFNSNGNINKNKVYDGNNTANLSTTDVSITGLEGTNTLSGFVFTSALYDTKNTGTSKHIFLQGLDFTLTSGRKSNYVLPAQSFDDDIYISGIVGNITAKTITPNFTVSSKTYDSTTSVSNSQITVVSVSGLISPDGITEALLTYDASYNVATAGTNNVNFINISTGNSNYVVNSSTQTITGVAINQRTLTLTFTASNKTYDNTTTASGVIILNNVQGSDSVSYSYSNITFDNKNVGTSKTVTINNVQITDANYTIATSFTSTANITTKTLVPTYTVTSKEYNKSNNASIGISGATGIFSGNDATINIISATFNSIYPATNIPVTATVSLSGTDASNYSIDTTPDGLTGEITIKSITSSWSVISKAYNRNTTATVSGTLNNVESGDVVNVSYSTATYDSIHVGTGKTVTISGIVLSGTDSAYYSTLDSASVTGDITTKAVTGNFTVVAKGYDANRTATVNYTLSGVVSGDSLTLSSGISATYADAIVGTGKTVTVIGIKLVGTNTTNYSISSTTTVLGDITIKQLIPIVTITAKSYDRSLTATVGSTSLSGLVVGDTVELLYTSANYRTFTVGTGKDVDISGLSLSGDVSITANYTLSQNYVSTTGDINQAPVTVSYPGPSKQFDGSNNITVSGSINTIYSGDTVTLTQNASFVGSSVGTGKQIDITNITLGGIHASNYILNSSSQTISGIITRKTITANYTGVNKVFDGSNNTTYSYSLNDLVPGYTNVTIAAGSVATFTNVNVGTNNVSITNISLTSTDAGNYTISSTGSTQADITQKRLGITFSVAPINYNGSTTATISGVITGIVSTENISFNNISATYDNKNVGSNKTVTVTGITISGDITNYTIDGTLTSSGTINQRPLTPLYTVQDKTYDQSNNAVVATRNVGNIVDGESVTLTETGATFDNVNAGSRSATITGIAISGPASSNYSIVTSASTTSNATINPATLTASFSTTNKTYDASRTASVTPSLSGILTGESALVSVNMVNVVANFDTKDVGTNKTVSVSSIALTGSGSSNYSVNSTASSTGNITIKQLGISFTTTTKYYDGTTTATVSGSLSDIVNSESVSFTYSSSTFDTKDNGSGKTVTITGINLDGSGSVISNYSVSGSVTSTGTINKKILSSSWTTVTRSYNTTRDVTVSGTLSGVVGVETVIVSGTGTIDHATVGTHPVSVTGISLSGTDNSNYELSSTTSSTTGTINALDIYGHGVNKTYDGTRNATVTLSGVLSISGVLDSVVVNNGLFDTLLADNNKSITGSLSGTDSSNYNLVSIANADILKKQITGVLVSRNYNGTNTVNVDLTGAALETVSSVRDDVTATSTLDNYIVGSRTSTSTTLGGTKASNYTLVLSASTVSITQKPIIAVTTDKVYNSTRIATLSLSGKESPGGSLDDVNISGSFNSKNIGSNVTISAYIYGQDSGNYLLNTDISANITARDISGTAQNRIYDSTRNVTITLNNTISGDNLSISGTVADKNVENGKTVTPVLSGSDASNYNFMSVSNVNITAKTLTATADNKTYNKANDVSFTFSGKVSGDDISLSGTFDSINVANGINVTLISTIYGVDISNYNFTSTLFSANINKKDITGSCTTRAYNGSTSIAVTLSNVISGDTVTCAGTLDNRRPGTRGVSGVLGGAQAGNYNLTGVSNVVISQKTVTGAGQTKTYDRTTTASVVLTGVETIDSSNVTITADYISYDVSANSSIVNGLLGGSESGNYSLGSISAGSITQKDISGTGLDKVYDRGTTALITLNGVIADDSSNVSYTANFANKSVASSKTISGSISGSRAFNYNLTSISNAAITLFGITGAASNKVYNGVDTATVTLTGVISGDTVSATGVFNNRLVGTGKSVTPTLAGGDSGNYNITNSGSITANITAKPITGTSVNRYYDRTTNVTVNLNDVETIDSSNVTLSGSISDKLVGSGKTVSGSLAGSASTNYSLTSISTVTISAKIITGTTANKTYDSLTTATITLSDVISGDTVTVTGNFSTRDVSSNKPVTGTIAGTDASNYSLSSVSNANITTKSITGTSTNRIYDRTTNVTVTLNSVEAFDLSNVTLSGSVADKTVANGKTVTGSLAGSRAFNYTLSSISTVNITKKDCSGTTQNKTYDGTTTATINIPLSGVISGDTVGCSADFDTRHVGNSKTASGTLTLTDAGNYNLVSLTNANITQKTITGTTADKTYDRLDTATITLNGVESIDTSNVTITGTFSSKDVSNNTKLVTASIAGSMSGNYLLGTVSRAMINAKRLTGTSMNKNYNASRSASVILSGVIPGDSVLISANFSDKNAGDSKTVTGTIYGTDYENYYIDGSSLSVANIQQKPVAVVLGNKYYDGTTSATGTVQDLEQVSGVTDDVTFTGFYISRDASDSVTGTGTLSGVDSANYDIDSFVNGRIYKKLIDGTTRNKTYDGVNTATIDLSGVVTVDSVRDSVSAVGTFATVRVADNIAVSGSLTGVHSGNYTLNSVSIANITPLTITASTSNKTYNASTNATITIDGGQLKTVSGSLDDVTISGTFDNKNIGTSKLVSAAISGTEAYNYILGTVTRANITKKTITATGVSRVYNGLTSVDLSLNSIESGDTVTGTATFASKYVGTSITISSGILAGTDASNYNLTTITAANITQRTVTGTGQNKVYNSLLTADVSLNNVVGGDNLTISANFISKDVSANSSITGTLHGTDVSNYTLSTISSAAITEKPITGYADNKTYNKSTSAVIHLNSIESGDTVTVTGTFSSDQIGSRSISSVTLAGLDGFNYSISSSDVSGATILARDIYGYGVNKTYNGTTSASVTLSDTISGDVISTSANFSDRFVGTGKSISGSLTGADSNNYNLLGIYPADITVKSISATPNNKTYDRTNSATFVLSGVETIDTSNVSVTGNYLRITVGNDISATATISGTMAYNYNLSTINNGSISGKHITGTAANKTYNASDVASVTLSGVISPDTVTVTATFSDRDVSSNKSVSGSISGADSGNYILDSISNANITVKSITGTSVDRDYDITTNVTVNLNNVETFDLSNVTLSGSMVDKLVGNNKTVSGTLSGSRAFNYLLSSISDVNISTKSITGTASNKTYNATTVASISLSGVISPDVVNVTGTFSTRDVSSNKPVSGTLSGTDATNYSLVSVSNANITAKPITGTSVDRIYDRTTNVSVNLNNVEAFDLSNVSLSGSMLNKVVGNNKTVSGSLGGSRSFNYSLSSISTVNISTKTISGNTSNKTYDGLTVASISLSGVISGDTVTISGDFNNKNIGTNKTVSGSISGSDADNYSLLSISNANITIRTVTGKGRDRAYNATTDIVVDLSNTILGDDISANGVINSKNIGSRVVLLTNLLGSDASNYTVGSIDNAVISTKNITANAQNKVYSSSTQTDISLNSIESGDVVTGVANFVSRYVANSVAIDLSSVVLSGLDRNNYNITSVTSANITQLTLTATGQNKVYNGLTNAVISYNNLVLSDIVNYEAYFDTRHVGTSKTISGVLTGGADVNNYILGAISNADITKLDISGTGYPKTYNGSTTASVTLNGVLSIDTSNVSVSADFNNRHVGNGKTISGSISGSSSGNYNLTAISNSNITALNITGYSQDKVYDRLRTATVQLPDVLGIDGSVTATANFSSKDVSSNVPVTGSLVGTNASNYTVTFTTANITKKPLTATPANKVYDSSSTTSFTLYGVIAPDNLSAVGSYNTPYVGTNKSATATLTDNITIFAEDWENQSSSPLGSFRSGPGDIYLSDDGTIQVSLGRDGTVNALSAVWISTNSGVSWSICKTGDPGIFRAFCMSGDGQRFYLMTSGLVYTSTDSGVTWSQGVNINSYNGGSICCSQNGQYVFVNSGNSAPSLSTDYGATFTMMSTGGVGPVCMSDDGSRLFTFSGTNDNSNTGVHYSYNYGATWTFSSTSSIIPAYTNAGYMTCNGAGTHIIINSVPVESIDGGVTWRIITALNNVLNYNWGRFAISQSGQYMLTTNVGKIWASRDYGVTWNIVQDSSSWAPLYQNPEVAAISRDSHVSVVYTNQGSGPGQGPIDLAIMRQSIYNNIPGSDSNNYSLSNSDISSGVITVKSITGIGLNKVYDRTVTATVTLNDVESVDLANIGCTASFSNKLVENSKSITGTLTGSSAYNYLLTGISSANITVKTLTGSTSNKTYNGSNIATVALSGVVPGDIVNVSATFSDILAENNKVVNAVISGADVSNYTLSSVSRANIEPKHIVGTGRNKVYDGLRAAVVDISSELVSVNGTLDSVGVTALFANKNVGTAISISGSINGTHASNYILDSIFSANITRKQVTAVGDNKVYDNTTAATTTLSGVIPADEGNVIAPVGIFTDKYVDTNITISLTNSISGSESGNYNLINNTTSADITPKALTVEWHVHNKTYDGTNTANVYYTSVSGVFVSDGIIFIDNFSASFDNAEAGFVKTVSIINIVLSGPKSYNYYAPDSTINGSILGKGSNLFINNGLTINQDTGLYSEEHNVESDLNFDYVVLFNVGALTGVNNNMTNIFSNSYYIQNSQNADDVNIHLTVPNHTDMSGMSFNWNEINQQNLITVSRGRATVGFGTFFAEPVRFGETLLEIMAHKIFGHAQARSAISNDVAFNQHDAQLWDHLSASVANRNFQLSVFNQYITSGRYNIENQNLESSDVYLNQHFNFDNMTFDFPLFLTGSLLVDGQSVNEGMIFRNGVNVGGAQIVNGLYNIPILLRFHD